MRKLLYISMALMLSTIMMVETVGMYITKSICTPCGSSSYEVEFVVTNDQDNLDCHHDHHKLNTQDTCCDEHNTCSHEDTQHKHNTEHQYVNHSPVFVDGINHVTFEPQLLAVLLPIIEHLEAAQQSNVPIIRKKDIPQAIPDDIYLSYICTFLI